MPSVCIGVQHGQSAAWACRMQQDNNSFPQQQQQYSISIKIHPSVFFIESLSQNITEVYLLLSSCQHPLPFGVLLDFHTIRYSLFISISVSLSLSLVCFVLVWLQGDRRFGWYIYTWERIGLYTNTIYIYIYPYI